MARAGARRVRARGIRGMAHRGACCALVRVWGRASRGDAGMCFDLVSARNRPSKNCLPIRHHRHSSSITESRATQNARTTTAAYFSAGAAYYAFIRANIGGAVGILCDRCCRLVFDVFGLCCHRSARHCGRNVVFCLAYRVAARLVPMAFVGLPMMPFDCQPRRPQYRDPCCCRSVSEDEADISLRNS